MSKRSPGVPTHGNDSVGWGYGYATHQNAPNEIIGRVLTLIEVLGLTEKQELPLKQMITQAVWEVFHHSVFLSPETHTELRTKKHDEEKRAMEAGVPSSAI